MADDPQDNAVLTALQRLAEQGSVQIGLLQGMNQLLAAAVAPQNGSGGNVPDAPIPPPTFQNDQQSGAPNSPTGATNPPPTPPNDRSAGASGTSPLDRLVDLAVDRNNLARATNYLLMSMMGGSSPGRGSRPPVDGRESHSDLNRLFQQHFGRRSKEVDPQKGLGRYFGRRGKQMWDESRARRWGKRAAKFGRGLGRTLGLGDKTSGAIGSVTGIIGKVAGAAASLVDAFVKVYGAVDRYTEAQMQAAARLAENSGELAQIMAVREVNQIQREMERGRRTSGTYGRLQEAEAERKIQENELGIVIDNAVNEILTFGNQVITPILEGFSMLLKAAEEMPGIGDAIKKLRNASERGVGSFEEIGIGTKAVEDFDRRAGDLMDRARAAAGAGPGGVVGPFGAAPPGRLIP